MSIYTFRIGIRDSKIYMRDNKMIKKTDVPKKIFEQLNSGATEVDDSEVDTSTNVKLCVVCKSYGNLTRVVNLQTVALCEEHYYGMNIGQLAQFIREHPSVQLKEA